MAYRSSGRSWQARHPPRYAAFLRPPSPSFGHSSRPDWGNRNTSADFFHDPFVMFGYLSGVTDLEFSTGVLILAQRQAVLVAKQAASLDVLCDGKFRLGVGVGWNP